MACPRTHVSYTEFISHIHTESQRAVRLRFLRPAELFLNLQHTARVTSQETARLLLTTTLYCLQASKHSSTPFPLGPDRGIETLLLRLSYYLKH